MSDEQNRSVIPTPHGELVPQWWAQCYGSTCMYRTTLDMSDPAQKTILRRSLNEDSTPVKEVLNMPIELIGYTISPVSSDKDGEISDWVRVVMHAADGRNISSGSMSLLRALMSYEQLERPAPWNPPIRVTIRAKDIGNGKQVYKVYDAQEPQTVKGKAK